MNTLLKIYDYIDQHFDEHLTATQCYLRQPSISPLNLGIQKCAEMTVDMLQELGAQSRLEPLENGHPVVYGHLKSKESDRTLLVYGMYDVQPVEPIEEWKSPPFDAAIIGERVVARGAINSKGPLMAFINALRSIRAITGDIPVNIIFVIEGEEELGSKHLPQFIERHVDELNIADAMYYHTFSETIKGFPHIYLGYKGIVYFELESRTLATDVHSMMAPVVDNPVWRLLWALNSMRGDDGRIVIDGFYENIQSLNDDDELMLKGLIDVYGPNTLKSSYGITQFHSGFNDEEFVKELTFAPTLNINGFLAGYIESGSKTIVPASATCKIDVRLVPNMTVQKVLDKVRTHLDRHGYEDIELRFVMGYGPSKTSMMEPVAQAAIRSIKSLGIMPKVIPLMPGSTPQVMFSGPPLNLPVVSSGLGHGGLLHAPNEYFEIEGLRACEKSAVAFLYEFAKAEN